MRKLILVTLAGAMLTTAPPTFGQDDGGDAGEVVVTGFRRLNPEDDDDRRVRDIVVSNPAPIQMLRRTADFAVQQVIVTGDTTGEDARREEIYAMTRKAIDAAAGAGVQVSTGELVVEPLTTSNYKDLVVSENDDDGGEMVKFLVKVPLKPGIDAKTALDKIARFIKGVPAVGRAQIKPYSELTLSVVNPEQYRGQIIDLVAKDTGSTSGRFGAGYGVEVDGLDRPVQWKRASLTEVHLFLPSNSKVRPRN